MTPFSFHNGHRRSSKLSLLAIILLSLFALISTLSTTTALPYPASVPAPEPVQSPIPVVSALPGGHEHHNNGSENDVDRKAPTISIRRPHRPRSKNQDQVGSMLRKRLDGDSAVSREQSHHVPLHIELGGRADEAPLLEKRGKPSASGYKPGGTGSGGQYDKGQPYGR